MSPHADVLVVGAGSAGCAVASRLARDRAVLLVEAGPAPDADTRRVDRLALGSRHDPGRFTRWFADDPPVMRGRAIGGSSVVNGGYFLRTPRDDFAGWGGPFTGAAIEAAYDELDGGAGPGGGTMSVSRPSDEEVPPVVRALEARWERAPAGPWPGPGVQRVPVNRRGGRRWTAADAYLSRPGAEPTVRSDTPIRRLIVERGRVVGAVSDSGEELRAGEVILCAGTLGSAELLLRSGIVRGSLAVYEHREVLVRYRPQQPSASCPVLLPSVVHTADAEIRLYADDFARFIAGVPSSTPAVGVAQMYPAEAGELRLDGDRLRVRLAPIGPVGDAVEQVVGALSSPAMADFVVDGSVRVEPVVGTSQHGWGSLAMGERTDWLGGFDGVSGLRVVDGSILPKVGSGPHATIMMAALVIADALR